MNIYKNINSIPLYHWAIKANHFVFAEFKSYKINLSFIILLLAIKVLLIVQILLAKKKILLRVKIFLGNKRFELLKV